MKFSSIGFDLLRREMSEYWPRSFLRVYKLAKKERGQCPAILTEKAWSMKELPYGERLSEKFFLRDAAGSPERAR